MSDDGGGNNLALLASNADWVSPGNAAAPGHIAGNYKTDPPLAEGGKVVITDTDHLWGHGATPSWAWRSFVRGLNPIFMDPWAPVPGEPIPGYPSGILNARDYPDWSPCAPRWACAPGGAVAGHEPHAPPAGPFARRRPVPGGRGAGVCRVCARRPGAAPSWCPVPPGTRSSGSWSARGSRSTAGTVGLAESENRVTVVSPGGHDAVAILRVVEQASGKIR
jgi:hypothetical protein